MVVETAAIRCLVVSDSAMHRLTLEHYVTLSTGLRLVSSLCDGVEAYDYLRCGGEVDLVISDLSSARVLPDELRPATHDSWPRWLLIEHMGNLPSFSSRPTGDMAQPLCFSHFGQLIKQAMNLRPPVA